MYPENVELNEQSLQRLIKAYQYTYKEIVNELLTATDFGVSNRRALLSQIEQALTDLGADMSEFINTEIPEAYRKGLLEADAQLNNVGADGPKLTNTFNQLHKAALAALMDDTSRAIGEGLSGINRSATTLLSKATREYMTLQVFKGIAAGETISHIRKMIKGHLTEQGLEALIDRAGHTWTFARYAEMLFRTKIVEARNRGLINRIVERGHDLVQVSGHLTSCEICKPWQGQILSATGATPGYKTVADAEASGLFHPNCRHAINTLIPSLARQTKAYNGASGKYELGYSFPKPVTLKAKNPVTKKPAAPKFVTVDFGKGHTFQVTENEAAFMRARNLELSINNRSRSWFGAYSEQGYKHCKIELNVNQIAKFKANPKYTVFHELGHALDYRKTYFTREIDGELKKIYTRYTNGPEFSKIAQADGQAVITNRIKRGMTNGAWAKLDISDEQITDIARGKVIKAKDKETGKDVPVGYSAKMLRYMRRYDEIFADGYGQWRLDPEKFESYAPQLAKLYKEYTWQP